MAVYIKSIDHVARVLHLGDDSSKWEYKLFFTTQTDTELMELAQNIFNQLSGAASLTLLDKYVGKELPSWAAISLARQGKIDLNKEATNAKEIK